MHICTYAHAHAPTHSEHMHMHMDMHPHMQHVHRCTYETTVHMHICTYEYFSHVCQVQAFTSKFPISRQSTMDASAATDASAAMDASATTDAPATVAEPSAGGDVLSAPLPSATDPSPTIGVVTEAPASTHGVVYIVENARTFSWASNKLNGNDACEHYPRVEKAKGALRAGQPAVHKDLNTIQLNTKYRALPEALLGNVRCLGTLRLAKGTTRHWVAVQALSDPLRSSSDPLAAVVGKVRKRCCNIAPSALSRNKSLTRSCPCCLVGVPHPVERDRPVRRTSLFWLRR